MHTHSILMHKHDAHSNYHIQIRCRRDAHACTNEYAHARERIRRKKGAWVAVLTPPVAGNALTFFFRGLI